MPKQSKAFTVTVPVTFTMIMGKNWTRGSILMGFAPTEVSHKGKVIGAIGADMGGSPYVEIDGNTFAANKLEIFESLFNSIDLTKLPAENPEPSKE